MMGFSLIYCIEESFVARSSGQQAGEYVVFKMPFSLPYNSDWSEPRPLEGKIQQGNQHYELVSQQVVNDTLYTVCRTDENARYRFLELSEHINQHIKETSSHPAKKRYSFLKDFFKEYTAAARKHIIYVLYWHVPLKTPPYFSHSYAFIASIHAPPPQA